MHEIRKGQHTNLLPYTNDDSSDTPRSIFSSETRQWSEMEKAYHEVRDENARLKASLESLLKSNDRTKGCNGLQNSATKNNNGSQHNGGNFGENCDGEKSKDAQSVSQKENLKPERPSDVIQSRQEGKLDLTAALKIRDIDAEMELARGINPELDSDRVCQNLIILINEYLAVEAFTLGLR